ncbi:MAG: alpha/beta hydrolase [bacterium]|nr:alpha/beta hydrolase [bacterium]
MNSQIDLFDTTESREKFIKAYNELMDTWTLPYDSKWVETSFGKTHVIVSGPSEGEPLVLLPGAQATSGMWGPMILTLSKKRRVYCIDLIDQVGLSQPVKVLTGTQDSNTWLKETLDGLKLTKIDIGGNSLGSFLASMFAVAYPERVRKLVLTAPAATVSGVRILYIIKILLVSMVSNISVKTLFLKKTAAGKVDSKNKLFQVLLMAMTESKVISKIMPRPLSAEEIHSLKSPILLILGSKDISANKSTDRIVKELSELKANIQFEILEDAGHIWTEHQYQYAGEKIDQFLDISL